MNPMPSVYVRPVHVSTMRPKSAGDDPSANIPQKYDCPGYMNKGRQVCSFTLLLNSSCDVQDWVLAGTALILDPGRNACLVRLS